MCRHVLNAQVSIKFPNGRWYECPECFLEVEGTLARLKEWDSIRTFACKSCRQVFMKDMRLFHPIDRRCPHCNNTFVLPGKTNEGDLAAHSHIVLSRELDELLAVPFPSTVAPSPVRDEKYIQNTSASRIQAKARGRAQRRRSQAAKNREEI